MILNTQDDNVSLKQMNERYLFERFFYTKTHTDINISLYSKTRLSPAMLKKTNYLVLLIKSSEKKKSIISKEKQTI